MPLDVARVVEIVAFILHFAAGLAVVGITYQCNSERFTNPGERMLPYDWAGWVARGGNATCNSTQACYRDAVPWADDEPLKNHAWNPYAMLMVFEFLSAGFALFYLREQTQGVLRQVCLYAPSCWFFVGFGLYIGWFVQGGQQQWQEVLVVFACFVASGAITLCFDGWREATLNELRRALAPLLAKRFQQCYLHGVAWRVPIRGPSMEAPGDGSMDQVVSQLSRRLEVILRYLEYCMSASLLFIAVLSLFVVGPPAWTFIVGFVSILMCNLFGACLQLVQIELTDESLAQPAPPGALSVQAGGVDPPALAQYNVKLHYTPLLKVPFQVAVTRRQAPGASLEADDQAPAIPDPNRPRHAGHAMLAFIGAGTWHEHWVCKLLYMEGAWFGLANGMLLIFYLGQGYLTNTSMPTFVLIGLWNMIALYCMFGVVATYFYVDNRYWYWLEPSLDVLSLAAKLPIVMSLLIGFLQGPWGGC